MTTEQSPIVIGIFRDELHAKNAVDELRTASFRYDQVGVAIKATQNATPDLQGDLMTLGVPQTEAHYYDDEYRSGNIVISIRPDGRNTEAQDILDKNGAYHYKNGTDSTTPENEQLSTNETTPAASDIVPDPAQTQPELPAQNVMVETTDASPEAESTEEHTANSES
jgi:hypothetical protein